MALDVTLATFEKEVLQASAEKPVIVDFWAEWCGPCRMLGPILDKLELDYAGQFKLVKVDTDSEQKLAGQYRISGIPAVKLFVNGAVVDEFTGALPEANIRRFLDRHLPDPAVQALQQEAESDPLTAAEKLAAAGSADSPQSEEILWRGVLALLKSEMLSDELQLVRLRAILESLQPIGGSYSDARKYLLQMLDNRTVGFERLHLLFTSGRESEALDYFLNQVAESSGSEREQAREELLGCFFLLGNTAPIVQEYRRKLSSILF